MTYLGEMWEKSPFTLMDFIKQRKRWLQGILLVVHDGRLPIRVRIGLGKFENDIDQKRREQLYFHLHFSLRYRFIFLDYVAIDFTKYYSYSALSYTFTLDN